LLDLTEAIGENNLLSLLVLFFFIKEGLDVGLHWIALENGQG